MIASYRSDSVGAGFGTGDSPVAAVVVERQRITGWTSLCISVAP